MDMPDPTYTHNGYTFSVSSEPMPSRTVTPQITTGKARLYFEPAGSAYETNLDNFEAAICGWSRIDPVNTDRLNRYFPLLWPLREQGSLNALEMNLPPSGRVAKIDGTPAGGINPTTVNNSGYTWWPTSPGCLYDTSFGPLPYSRFMTDAEAYATPSSPKELGRFVKVDERAVPREFRRSDFGFVYFESGQQREVLQVGFVPFIQAEVMYVWFQVPYPDGVPWNTIESTYLKVNASDFDGDDLAVGYPAGTLLLTKTGPLDDWYFGPGGKKYTNVIYYVTYNPYGWNKYIKPSGTFVDLYRKNVTPLTPPYGSANYNDLFNPGAG